MSTFEVRVRELEVVEHPDADSLEIVNVLGTGYQCVARKGEWLTGQTAMYIPEQAVLPDKLIQEMGLEGLLAGSQKNRVKAIRLRGILSQGLLYWPRDWTRVPGAQESIDYAPSLGIVKYQPPIPMEMSGKVYECEGIHSYTDIENIKNHPDIFEDGEQVVITEKIHGTCAIYMWDGAEMHVSSKGMASKGLAIEESEGNVYWRAAKQVGLEETMNAMAGWRFSPFFIFGEVYGVQDLHYGLQKGQVGLRVFDIMENGIYYNVLEFEACCELHQLATVPVLYRGPFSKEVVDSFTMGETQVGTDGSIREGIVIRPVVERFDMRLGRVILKSISPDYLTRKNKNATEYE